MNLKLSVQLVSIFIVALSLAAVPGKLEANATFGLRPLFPPPPPPLPWIGSGPFSDTLQLTYFNNDTREYNAICFAQPSTCNPQVDLTDVQIPTSEITPANTNDPRFYVTPLSPSFDYEHVDFNLANSFFGVEFCNGADGITTASTCPDGPGATAMPATCPNVPAPHSGDCTFAAISIRQAIAHLIDKAGYVTNVLHTYGVAIDNVLALAQNTLHSGQDISPPPFTCSNNPKYAGGSCNTIGAYAVDPIAPIGSQQVFPPSLGGTFAGPPCTTPAQIQGLGGSCYLSVAGACSWDVLASTCSSLIEGQSQVSAFHLTGDAPATAWGMVPTCTPPTPPTTGACTSGSIASPDFCAAAQDFVNAGVGSAVSTPATGCQILGFTGFNTGTPGTPGGPLLLYRRTSLDRGPLFDGLGTSLCQLIHGPGATENCAEVQVKTIDLAQAHSMVFSQGCLSFPKAGTSCGFVGPRRTWNLYDGANTLAVTINNLYSLYTSQFASDLCGGNSPSDEPPNYVLSCNATSDTWSNYTESASTPGAAVADTQVANDIFGSHAFTIPVYSHYSQNAWLSGWGGASPALGISMTQGNFYRPLNAYNPNPTVYGPTIRWGQMSDISSLNPFSYGSEVESNVIQNVYDRLLAPNPYNPTSLYGYMANSYQIVHNGQDSNCPVNVQVSTGTFPVAGCVKMALRGDNSWHDIYNCTHTDGVCLQSHVVTAQDVKFSVAGYNATGGLNAPSTQNIVDVLYNPSSLPSVAFSTYGGTESSGQPEIFYLALKSISAWSLFDIASIPIVPQHVWKTSTAIGPCLSPALGGSTVNDTYAGTSACQLEPSFVSGPESDPIANGRLIGSGPWVCASGTLGFSGIVIGGPQCSTSLNQSPGAGDIITLRRFQYQGTNAAQQGSLNLNFAYFRTNGKFKNFAWADYLSARGSGLPNGLGAEGIVEIRDIQSVASCLHVAPPYTTAPCNHWSSPASTSSPVPTAGPNIGLVGGGRGASVQVNIGTVAQVARWYNMQWYNGGGFSPLLYGVNGNQLNPGSLPPVGTNTQALYEDGTNETS